MKQLNKRCLGRSGLEVSAMGLGCWAIGGPFSSGPGCRYPTGAPLGWGEVDDGESARAIHCALDHGITLFDTADAYGTGHSERVLGQALKGRRAEVLVATKFGNTYDSAKRQLTGSDVTPAYVRRACEASLARLGTDWIDLYQLHVGDLALEEAHEVADCLEALCDDGLIRLYGWSTDDPERAAAFAGRPRAAAVQHDLNLFQDAPALLEICQTHDFASINRQPLAMGFLSGKFTASSSLPASDIRAQPPDWLTYFEQDGRAAPAFLAKLEAIRDVLTSDGRTLVQGALAWIWARGPHTLPIPGFRTEAQVRENAAAMAFGPLTAGQMEEIESLLGRAEEPRLCKDRGAA
ncbi:MAG: aldo/keto reductase [Pseudomonadota bacterium]